MTSTASARAVLLLLAFLAPLCGDAVAQEAAAFKVVVHPDNLVSELSRRQVSNLFLGKVGRWDAGEAVKPIDLQQSSAVRDEFSRAVHQRSTTAVKNHWLRAIFSGKSEAPPEAASDAEVIAYVVSHPGGIGYVAANANTGSAKVITVVGF